MREAALVAQPALVHVGVVAGDHAPHVALAHGRPDVAARRAERAHAGDVRDLPGSRLEAVLGRGQRAHRAQLDDVARETTPVGLFLERGDHRARAALARDQLLVLGDVLGEARAAVAEDAALAVERDQRRDRERLLVGALVEVEARVARPVAVGQVLQRALAALVADGAVERVVEQDELEHGLLALGRARPSACAPSSRRRRSSCKPPAASACPRPRPGTCGRRRWPARAAARSRRWGSRPLPWRRPARAACPWAPSARGRRSRA